MMKMKRLSQIIGYVTLATMAPPKTFAALEEVIVTAQKQEENMQSVPISISALTTEQLQRKGITSFQGVALNSPSITFMPFPSSGNTLTVYIRGQGIGDPGQIAADGAVGLYVDGFYIARPQASTFDLADVERVEVLRGPQGTLYGRNTIGGAVNIISKTPTGEFGFKQDFSFGNYNYFRSLTTINLPKVGDLSTKFSILKSDKDGYVKNLGSGRDYGEEYQRGGRFSLRWDPLSELYVDYFLEKGDLDSTPPYFQVPAQNGKTYKYLNGATLPPYYAADHRMTHTYRPVDLNLSTSNFEGHGLTVTWDLNDSVTLKSLTGYRKLYYTAYQDYAEAFSGTYRTTDVYHQHQFSQEFQIIGNALDNRINYIGGLYYFEEAGFHQNLVMMTLLAPSYQDRKVDADGKSRAAFGQLTWTPPILDDRLDITLGGRFTRDVKNAQRYSLNRKLSDNSVINVVENGTDGAANRQHFSRFNPALTLNYKWTDDISTYAKATTGYKAGGSDEAVPTGQFSSTYGPEELTNYEVGLKSYWFDHTLRANITYFYDKLKDKQMSFKIDPSQVSLTQVFNAGRMVVKGVESEFVWAPSEDFSMNLDYVFLDAAFTEIKAPENTVFNPIRNPSSPVGLGEDVSGYFAPNGAPKNSVNVGANYTFMHFDAATLTASVDYRWQDRYKTSFGPRVPGDELAWYPSYGLWNGRLTLAMDLPKGDKAKISFWGKNIFHANYYQYLIPGPGPSISILGKPYGLTYKNIAWNEPPTWGIDLNYEY